MTLTLAQRGGFQQQVRSTLGPKPTLHELKLLQTFSPFDFNAAADECQDWGLTGLLVKAMDGDVWMSRYDGSPDALGSLEELERQVRWAHDLGLYYFCWTNPLTSVTMPLEATMYGQIARSCDGLFLDVEPYNQFWGANHPAGLATQFMQWIRGEAPNAFIALQPDPRPGALGEIKVWEWMAYCDAIAGQHYWSDFVKPATANIYDARDELVWAKQLQDTYGPNLITLPGNAPPTSFPLPEISEFPGLIVWRMGTTPASVLGQIARTDVRGLESTKLVHP